MNNNIGNNNSNNSNNYNNNINQPNPNLNQPNPNQQNNFEQNKPKYDDINNINKFDNININSNKKMDIDDFLGGGKSNNIILT